MGATDACASKNELRTNERTGWVGDWYHWPNNVLTFQFSAKFADWQKYLIRTILAQLERKLDFCVTFRESWSPDAVKVRQGEGCSSVVGYQGFFIGQLFFSTASGALGVVPFSDIYIYILHTYYPRR